MKKLFLQLFLSHAGKKVQISELLFNDFELFLEILLFKKKVPIMNFVDKKKNTNNDDHTFIIIMIIIGAQYFSITQHCR